MQAGMISLWSAKSQNVILALYGYIALSGDRKAIMQDISF